MPITPLNNINEALDPVQIIGKYQTLDNSNKAQIAFLDSMYDVIMRIQEPEISTDTRGKSDITTYLDSMNNDPEVTVMFYDPSSVLGNDTHFDTGKFVNIQVIYGSTGRSYNTPTFVTLKTLQHTKLYNKVVRDNKNMA